MEMNRLLQEMNDKEKNTKDDYNYFSNSQEEAFNDKNQQQEVVIEVEGNSLVNSFEGTVKHENEQERVRELTIQVQIPPK